MLAGRLVRGREQPTVLTIRFPACEAQRRKPRQLMVMTLRALCDNNTGAPA